MKFGYFDDKNREYVITSPKTPYPWINYLGTQGFFSLISNTAGGYCFYKDARLRRITRYRYNNVPIDMGGRYFYINDGGHVWNPGWSPVKTTLDSYECRHGMGYTIIKGSSNGVTATVTFFVPQNFNGEIQKVTIKNDSDKEKNLKLFSFLEWCLWDANDDTTNFQRNFNTGEVEIDGSVIYHKTEYKERRDHYAFYSVNAPINGYDTDRESFLGLYNGFDAPQTVFAGAPNMSVADGWSPVASHYIEIKLQPGESKDLVFCLGYVENKFEEKFAPDLDENSTIITSGDRKKNIVNKAKAKAMMAMCDTAEKADKLLAELKEHWNSLLGQYSVNSPDEKLNRMVNIWNQYQCMVTFNMSRSASYFESGIGRGMGFRDSNQDLLGFVHQIPARARERLIDLAATMLEDGGAYHQYQPLTKKGNSDIGSGFNDDPLWLIAGTAAYLSASDQKVNTLAVGHVTTEIEENFPDPTPTPVEENPSYIKEIWAGNFSGGERGFHADCYVRMALSYSNYDVGKGVELLGLDTVNWLYNNEDGYYYYRNVVTEGEKTTPLCSGFRIDSSKIDDTYKDSITDFEINVYEESVQAEGFSDFESAWNYFKNPISADTERSEKLEEIS